MTALADVTLPIDNSNAKQLDVTPLPQPSSLTEAELFMTRTIFQNIEMPPPHDDNTSRSYLPVDNSNAKQLDVTPLPLPSSLTEAELFMPRAIFQNKNKATITR